MEKSNWLPELPVISARSFGCQPVLIISLGEGFKALLGEMEPGGLIGSKDQSFAHREDTLEALGG